MYKQRQSPNHTTLTHPRQAPITDAVPRNKPTRRKKSKKTQRDKLNCVHCALITSAPHTTRSWSANILTSLHQSRRSTTKCSTMLDPTISSMSQRPDRHNACGIPFTTKPSKRSDRATRTTTPPRPKAGQRTVTWPGQSTTLASHGSANQRLASCGPVNQRLAFSCYYCYNCNGHQIEPTSLLRKGVLLFITSMPSASRFSQQPALLTRTNFVFVRLGRSVDGVLPRRR